MDFAITTDGVIGQMTLNKATGLGNNVFLSLAIDQGAFFVNPAFGSRLHLLKRAKLTDKTRLLAIEYCREALQWLIDSGRATAVEVEAERDRQQHTGRLKLSVSVTEAAGRRYTFTYFIEVV